MTLDNSPFQNDRSSSPFDDEKTPRDRHTGFDSVPDWNEELSDAATPHTNRYAWRRQRSVASRGDDLEEGEIPTIFLVLPSGERIEVAPNDLRKMLKENSLVKKYSVEFETFVPTGLKARDFIPQLKRRSDSFFIPEKSFASPEMIVAGSLVALVLILALFFVAKELRKEPAPKSNAAPTAEAGPDAPAPTESEPTEAAPDVPAFDPEADDPFATPTVATESVSATDDSAVDSTAPTEPIAVAPETDDPFAAPTVATESVSATDDSAVDSTAPTEPIAVAPETDDPAVSSTDSIETADAETVEDGVGNEAIEPVDFDNSDPSELFPVDSNETDSEGESETDSVVEPNNETKPTSPSASSDGAKGPRPGQPTPSSPSYGRAEIDGGGWLVAPFDVTLNRIPEGFKGHNFDRICAELAREREPGEPLFGTIAPTAKLAFVIPNKASVAKGVPFFGGACDYVTVSYLPAPKEMSVKKNLSHYSVSFFDGTKVAPLLLGEGAKGLALESPFEEDFKWANSDAYCWKIRSVRRDEFDKIKDKVAVLCVLNVDYRSAEESGLLASKGNYALYSRKAEFWVYNSETGVIYGKFDLAETLQENPHPHDVSSVERGSVGKETPRRSIGAN